MQSHLNTVSVSSIGPARWRKRHQVMREVNKDIDQIPMPYRKRLGVCPALHELVIRVPSRHVMADQIPRPLRQTGGGRQLHAGLVERVMERLEVSSGLQFLERLQRVGDRNRRLQRIKRRRGIGGGTVCHWKCQYE